MSKWYQGSGKNSDVVLYSKVRLSRNLADSPFPSKMSAEIRKNVTKKLWATVKSSPLANEFEIVNIASLSEAEAMSYAEKRLISEKHARDKAASFLLSNNEDISVMLCEEDHIIINAFSSGQTLSQAYKKADELDDVFIKTLKIAYSDKLGFLTSSPVNLGTGLKASYALHLPALADNGTVYRLMAMVGKLGLTLREMFENGAGDIYVLSNQVSLGISEKSAIDNICAICDQIVKQERKAREELKENINFEDKIYRTMGILKSARKLDFEEFLDSLSLARLGASLKYLDIDYETIGDMLYGLQNAALIASSGAELNDQLCSKLRAQIVRERLE
ncbi:MAG: ATP--guanido phosphotransferase [Eubacterium sp.]|nr:ATP--guanido phosphotransferase [Eubacterium sp.]